MLRKSLKSYLIVSIFFIVITLSACNQKPNTTKDDNNAISSTENDDNTTTTIPGNGDNDNIVGTLGNTDNNDISSNMLDDNGESNENTGDMDEFDINSIKRVATKEIYIYSLSESTTEVESVVALIPESSEITPQLIIDLVASSFEDRFIEVGIESVTTRDDMVIVSFLSEYPPIINVGKELEINILDAIAQSLVDNLDNYSKVSFRLNGKAYKSDNFEFKIDEVYLVN